MTSDIDSYRSQALRSYDAVECISFLQSFEASCKQVETPCGEGTMAWRIWGKIGEQANLPPLILTHGAQGTWQHWVRNIEELSQYRCVIVADLPGHGSSALPESPDHEGISIALHVGLKTILGVASEAVDFCGFSFGGVVFAHFAALYPQWVKRLVIVGCGGLNTPLGHPRLGRVSGLVGEERRAALRNNLLGLMLHHSESVDDLAIHMLLPMAKAARLSVQTLVLPDRLLRILPEVAAPVDAIWGANDLPHPNPDVQKAALLSVKPDARFDVIEDAGHWVMYERPKAFNTALLSFLGDVPSI